MWRVLLEFVCCSWGKQQLYKFMHQVRVCMNMVLPIVVVVGFFLHWWILRRARRGIWVIHKAYRSGRVLWLYRCSPSLGSSAFVVIFFRLVDGFHGGMIMHVFVAIDGCTTTLGSCNLVVFCSALRRVVWGKKAMKKSSQSIVYTHMQKGKNNA